MNIAELYTIREYEVLGEETQKYASTSVHGGNSHHGGVSVSSTTTYHSDQDIWVKDIKTGDERKFSFSSFNVDVRPGHKILCVWDKETDRLERVININTNEWSAASGFFNQKNLNKTKFRPLFINSVICGISTIPFLNFVSIPVIIFGHLLPGKSPFTDTKIFPDNRKNALVAIGLSLIPFAPIFFKDDFRSGFSTLAIIYPLFVFLACKAGKNEHNFIKARRDALVEHLENHISSLKQVAAAA